MTKAEEWCQRAITSGAGDRVHPELVARLRNGSDEAVCAPVHVYAVLRVPGVDTTSADHPRFIDPRTGLSGRRVRFDYTPTLRDLRCLPPGGLTEALVWKLNVPVPYPFQIETEVTAR